MHYVLRLMIYEMFPDDLSMMAQLFLIVLCCRINCPWLWICAWCFFIDWWGNIYDLWLARCVWVFFETKTFTFLWLMVDGLRMILVALWLVMILVDWWLMIDDLFDWCIIDVWRVPIDQCWLMGGVWWLMVGVWRLVVGGWRLMSYGWCLMLDGLLFQVYGLRFKVYGLWFMAYG